MKKEIRALVNIKFSIPEKNHLKVLAQIVEILYKSKTRDFEFLQLTSNMSDGYLKYDQEKQPEINPKQLLTIRKKLDGKMCYQVKEKKLNF